MSAGAVSALIGMCTALLVLTVGRYWDGVIKRRDWHVLHRQRAYQRVMEAFFSMREALRAVAEAGRGSEEEKRAADGVTSLGVEWNSAIAEAWMFGTPAAFDLLLKLDSEIDELFATALESQFSFLEWHQNRRVSQRVFERLAEQVSKDLRLPTNPAMRFEDPARSAKARWTVGLETDPVDQDHPPDPD
jgi:hypothetical protein